MRMLNTMKHYKLWFAFSGAVIVLGFVMMFMNGLNLGIDFTGGTMMQVELGKEISVAEISDVIKSFDLNPDTLSTQRHFSLVKHCFNGGIM